MLRSLVLAIGVVLYYSFFNSVFAFTDINGNIRGLVTNKESGQVIRGATVTLRPYGKTGKNKYENEQKCYSMDAGEYLFSEVPPGIYNLECTAFGYQTLRLMGIQVREDHTKLAYFKMVRGSAAIVNETYLYAALEAKQSEEISTGTSNKEALSDAPASVYVITTEDIEERGYVALSDVLSDIPEIEIHQRSNPETFNTMSVRGITGNKKMLLLIDGRRANSMTSSDYALDYNYNIRFMERIEIILGPASALYGADAFSGVVNMITKKGNKGQGAALSSSYGMYNTSTSSLQFGFAKEKFSFSFTGGFHYDSGPDFPSIYKNEFFNYNTQYLQTGLMSGDPSRNQLSQTLEIKPFDHSKVGYFGTLNLQFNKVTIGLFHSQERHSSSTGLNPNFALYWDNARYGTAMSGAYFAHSYQPKNNKKWSLESLVNMTYHLLVGNSNTITATNNYQRGYLAGANSGGRIQETFRYTFNENHKLAAGITLQHSLALPITASLPYQIGRQTPISVLNTEELNLYYIGSDYKDEDGNSLRVYQDLYSMRRIIGGAFFEYRFNLKDKFLMTLGLRYDHVIDVNEFKDNPDFNDYYNFNPRLGLVYKPNDNWRLKFFYGEGFLEPSPEDKFQHNGIFEPVDPVSNGTYERLNGGFWHLPNEKLKDQSTRTGELSISFSKGNLVVVVNSYVNILERLFQRQTNFLDANFKGIPITGSEQLVNSKYTNFTYGSTAHLDYQFLFGAKEQFKFKLFASYSYSDGFIVGLEQLPFTAKHRVKAGLLFKAYNFSIFNRITYRSASFNDGVVDNYGNFVQLGNAPFFVWNLFAKYHIPIKKTKLDFFVRVTNVLNNRYYHTSTASLIAFGATPQDPIRVEGGFTVSFGQ